MLFETIKVPVGQNKFVDISRAGIDAYLGQKDSVATRNNVSIKLDNGLPGTGIYSWTRDGKINPLVLVGFAFIFFTGFNMLTLMAINADYSMHKFISNFFTWVNLLLVFLFFFINLLGVYGVFYYKKIQCLKVLRYKEKLSQEIENVRIASLKAEPNSIKYDILSSYLNCLYIEQEIIEVEPVMSALQNYPKKYSGIKEEYEKRYQELQEDLQENRYKVDGKLTDEELSSYHHLCEAFEILSSGNRFWDITANEKDFKHTVFGAGMFDYIYSNSYPPIMKAVNGTSVYIYSKFLLVSRSTTDFDIIPLTSLDISISYYPGSHKNITIISLDSLGLKFTTTSMEDANFFIKEFDAYRNGEYHKDDLMLKTDSLLEEAALYVIFKRKISHDNIRKHLNIGNTRTRRILKQLQDLQIISGEDENGLRTILVWDIEKIREIIAKAKEDSIYHLS